jgi:hypothetical protein
MQTEYDIYPISDRISINMNDFIKLIHKYIDVSNIFTIVDAGSMDGNDAVILWNEFPYTKSYAIEGLYNNYIKFIKDKPNIIGINEVISSYDGEIIYYEKDINGIHGIYDRGNQYGNKKILLPCLKMSTIINKYNIKNIDILKIDVEGATYDLLLSLEDYLQHIKIMHIETETFAFFSGQKLHNDTCTYLKNNNFECVDITFCEILPLKYQSDSVWINKKYIKNNV